MRPIWMDEFEEAGHRLNRDGTVTVYHATTAARAKRIVAEGVLRRPKNAPDSYGVYFSTSPDVAENYGDGTVVKMRVKARDLHYDDWFPSGRMDFHARTRGGVYRPAKIEGVMTMENPVPQRNQFGKIHKVPANVRKKAEEGLEIRRWRSLKTKRPGGTSIGISRAQKLSSGQVDEQTIRRMKAFFDRFQYLKQHPDWGKPTMPGYVAWLLWGGDPGYTWAKKKVAEMNRENPFGGGEWWIDEDGMTMYADGDIGEMDHVAYAFESMLGISLDDPDIPEMLPFEPLSDEAKEYLEDIGADPKAIAFLEEGGDPRDYAMEHMGWIRIQGQHIQVWKLDNNTADLIGAGASEAYGFDDEENWPSERDLAIIEEQSTNKVYEIPATLLLEPRLTVTKIRKAAR